MSRKTTSRDIQNTIIKWFGAGFILLMGIVIGTALQRPAERSGQNRIIPPSPAYSMEVLTIAELFECACGSCTEPELARCECPTAIREKNAIQNLLNKGHSADMIVDAIETTYGHKKAI